MPWSSPSATADREEHEIDVLAGLVEHAPLPVAVERRLEEGDERLAELAHPGYVVRVPRGVVEKKDEIEIRPSVGRDNAPRLGAH